MNKLISVDFNDTIINQGVGPDRVEDWRDGLPMPGARETINNLIANGYQIEVLTSRPEEEWADIKTWLDTFRFSPLEVTNIKKPALAYIDNRGIRFTNWSDIAFMYL